MIVIKGLPNVVEGSVCPLFSTRVLNQSGNTLVIATYDVMTREKIGESTYSITSDDFTVTDVAPTPEINEDTILNIIVAVLDSGGNVVEQVNNFVYFTPNPVFYDIEKDAEVWYVTKYGFTFKKRFAKSQWDRIPIPSSNICYTLIHQDGKLAFYEGSDKKLEVAGDSAVIDLQFKVSKEIAIAYANEIDREDIQEIIFKVPELAPTVGAFRAIEKVYETKRFTPMAVSVVEDANYVYYNIVTQVDLHTPVDMWAVLKIVAGIGAIVAGGVLLVASFGASAPASAFLIGTGIASIGAGAYVLWESFQQAPSKVVEKAKQDVDKAKQDITVTYNNLADYLNQLVNEGRLTQEEANKVLDYVTSIKDRAFKAFDELYNSVKEAYKEGYDDAMKKMQWYIAGAGGVGFIAGVIVGAK